MGLDEPALKEVPIAVLGMKIDIEGAVSESTFREAMGLASQSYAGRSIEVFMGSVLEMHGAHRIGEAIQWLSTRIPEDRLKKRLETKPACSTASLEAGGEEDEDMMV